MICELGWSLICEICFQDVPSFLTFCEKRFQKMICDPNFSKRLRHFVNKWNSCKIKSFLSVNVQTHDFRPNLAPQVVKKRAKDRKRSQKWAKNGPTGAKGGQMGAKRKAKGAKRESKGPKREPTGAKGQPKGAKKTTKMRSKIDVRKRSPNRGSKRGGR